MKTKKAVPTGNSVARATYLEHAYLHIRTNLLPEAPALAAIALAFSFPIRHARTAKVIGECHHVSDKKSTERHLITIHPHVWNGGALQVLAVLAHEMAHACLPLKAGHRRPFALLVERIGLEGPPTATVPGGAFMKFVGDANRVLPKFPGGIPLTFKAGKKQTTRMRLYECSCEPVIKIRTGRDDLDCTCNECGENFALQDTGGGE